MVETMVSDSRFQNQLASIMETLAKTAILEIGKLVEESHAVFRSEISRRRSENESLKNKCDLLESELRASRSAQQRAQTLESARPAAKEARHHPTIDSVFGKEWCLGLWKENGPAANQKSQSHVDCCMMESSDMIDDGPETIIIKDETNEDCPGKSKPQADPASEKDMEEDLESFLRSREVPEKDIYKMKRDKEMIIGKEDSAEGTSELKNSRVEERKTLFVSGQSSALSIISPTDQQSRQANAVDVMEANGFSEEMMVGAHDHAESTPGLNNCTVTSVVSDILTNCQPLQNAPDFMMLSDLSKVVSVADDQGKGKSGLDEISEEDHKIPDSACSTMWHEQCFESLKVSSESESYEESEDEMLSGEEYVLCSTMDTETESEQEDADRSSVLQTESEKATTACSSAHDNSMDSINIGKNETSSNTKHSTSYAELAQSTTLTKAGLNYCFVCGEAQSKIARHFKVHIKEEAEIAKVLSLPVRSGERKQLLETLRNRGNFNHNNEVLKKGEGSLKVKRRPLQYKECKKYEYCLHCKGMFLRRELWRHVRQCRSKPAVSDKPTKGRQRVLPKTATQYHIITSKKAETPTGLSKLPLGSPKLSTRVH